MGESKMGVTFWLWGCAHPKSAWLAAALGLAIVPIVGFAWHEYLDAIKPIPPVILSAFAHPRDANGSVLIEVKFRTTPTKHCIRIGGHMLTPPGDEPIDDIAFDFLPGSVAGEGWQARVSERFTLRFHMPSTIAPGQYRYVYRRFLQCDPWKLVPFQDAVSWEVTIP